MIDSLLSNVCIGQGACRIRHVETYRKQPQLDRNDGSDNTWALHVSPLTTRLVKTINACDACVIQEKNLLSNLSYFFPLAV